MYDLYIVPLRPNISLRFPESIDSKCQLNCPELEPPEPPAPMGRLISASSVFKFGYFGGLPGPGPEPVLFPRKLSKSKELIKLSYFISLLHIPLPRPLITQFTTLRNTLKSEMSIAQRFLNYPSNLLKLPFRDDIPRFSDTRTIF